MKMYHKLFDLLYSFDAETIEQAVALGETLNYWKQYKDKNITDDGMHIWHLHMPLKVWEDLLSSRVNRRKSIYFPDRNKAHVWGKGLAQDDTIHESKVIKLTRRQLEKLISESIRVPSIFKNTGIAPPDPEQLRLLNREFAHQNLEIEKRRAVQNHPNEMIRSLASQYDDDGDFKDDVQREMDLNMAIELADSLGYFDKLKLKLGLDPEDD